MATRYHFNPDTGRVGACQALVSCRFSQSAAQHGATKEEARANYEASMDPQTFANTSSKPAATPVRKLTDIAELRSMEMPRGMDGYSEHTGNDLKNYSLEGAEVEWYIGGRHKVLDRPRSVDIGGGRKAWKFSVETDGERHSMLLPMRKSFPTALKYTPEGREKRARQLEIARANKERWAARKEAERARSEAVERIASTSYEDLSEDDRAIADELRAEEEERRWSRNPSPLVYRGPTQYGSLRENPDSFLEKLRGVPDYDLKDYNDKVSELAASDLPREEQERQIRSHRVDYIDSMDAMLDRRLEAANSRRATRYGLKENLRSFFGSPDEKDEKVRSDARDRVLKNKETMLAFAKELFAAPYYAQVNFHGSRRF